MIQSLHFQKVRVPALAAGAVALVALGATALPRLGLGAAAPEAIVVQVPAVTLAQRPLIAQPQPDQTACGAGAYVSGDMAGDSSPAAIYSAKCGGRP
jgi:hypothetical protein